MTFNSLQHPNGLPPFSTISPELVVPALDEILADNRREITGLLNDSTPKTWDSFILPMEALEDRLHRMWSPVRHLNSVMNSDDLREVYNECLPKLSDYSTELGQNAELYAAYQEIADSTQFDSLSAAQKKVIENALRSFKLSGVSLAQDKKERFKALSMKLSELSTKYEENVLDATNAWEKHITSENQLQGLPASAMGMTAQTAVEKELEGWVLTLQFPSFNAVMTYADDRSLREEMYRAFSTRASDQGSNSEWDNSVTMRNILAARHESAQLLGFANYAERSLATKMADSPDEVHDFLLNLADKSKPSAVKDYQDLCQFASGVLGIPDVQAWDVAYVSEKMRGSLYDLSQEDLKPYFPVNNVVKGMFTLVEGLYRIKITENNSVDTWHNDVQFFDIHDEQGTLKAQFYFDLYARKHKRGGAWMDVCISRRKIAQGIQTPVAYMTCNSSSPIGDKTALFTHNEVITLFHEFGHGLHHMLTQVEEMDVSGISGVEWDAVELPSQFMENWCWERKVLDMFALHHETGETMPDELFDKLVRSKNFQAGMMMVRQIEFALFDLCMHWKYSPDVVDDYIQKTLDETREQVSVIKPPEFNRFQNGFSHIFAGGYAAGYYSYKWAEVLSADAFAKFEEDGLFNTETGHSFLENVLEVGGSRNAMESFVAFRGRKPEINALLRHNGLVEA